MDGRISLDGKSGCSSRPPPLRRDHTGSASINRRWIRRDEKTPTQYTYTSTFVSMTG